ncbi:hypothetical protein [Streptomyces sp. NPDC057702]|uniref:hypothetical protein n=1 Tax=unclassified Streptomyces TaxID=2593676 RepID=UPI0036C0055E
MTEPHDAPTEPGRDARTEDDAHDPAPRDAARADGADVREAGASDQDGAREDAVAEPATHEGPTAREREAARARRWRSARRVGALVVVLGLAAGAHYWFGGGYDRYKNDKLLGGACEGVLAKREARAILGDGPLKKGDGGQRATGSFAGGEDQGSLRVRCSVRRDLEYNAGKPTVEASVTVTVSGVPTRGAYESHFGEGDASLPRGPAPVPLGDGWTGIFATDDRGSDALRAAHTSVVLDCADSPNDLLVTARVEEEDSTLDNPDSRAAFARVATATAKKAARHWGCDARLGKDPTSVPLPVNEREYVPLRGADGTCAGVAAAGTPRGGLRVPHAWESTRARAPYEACVVGEDGARWRYRLRALYGPYAEEMRHVLRSQGRLSASRPDFARERAGYADVPQLHQWWGSAECGAGDRALFTAEKVENFDSYDRDGTRDREPRADAAYQRRALAEFARRSAASHGCAAPTTP